MSTPTLVDWPAWIQAGSSLAIAALTAVLWWATRRYADAADEQTKASQALVAAAGDQAQIASATLEHLRAERELAWRPYVVWGHDYPNPELSNFGRGPALNLRALRLEQAAEGHWQWHASKRLDLEPMQRIRVIDGLQTVVGAIETPTELSGKIVVLCQDQIGKTHVFLPDDRQPLVWAAEDVPEPWRMLSVRLLGPS